MNHETNRFDQPVINPARRLRAVSAFVLLALVFAVPMLLLDPGVLAQDGTGAATPTPPTNCVPPAVTVMDGPRDAQSPLVPNLAATPGESPVASPVTSTPRSSLEVDITETSRVLVNCLSENKLETVAALTGDTFRGQLLGADEDIDGATYIALAGTLTPVRYGLLSIEDIRGTGRGTAEASVTYTVSHQLRTATWSFQLVNTGIARKWIVTSEELQETRAPADTPAIAVTIADDAFRLTPDEVEGNTVKLDGTNDDPGDHEMLVVKLASGASSDLLLTSPGPELPEGVEFIGQLTIPAQSTGSLVLTNLEPGTYTIVCLLPDDNGVPYLASGMQTTFELTSR